MNALRQFITPTDDTLIIRLPKSYQKQPLEVIVLPMTNYDDDIVKVLEDEKIKTKAFWDSIDQMRIEAKKNGLTPEILESILNDDE